MPAPRLSDRLRMRERPAAQPVMFQSWQELLFLHWQVPVEWLQSTLPAGLHVDTFEGQAWLGVVPFWMRRIRPRWCPAVPGISNFLELNLRTYVHDDHGTSGVWFYSLDANQSLAVWAARTCFHLNYQSARMQSHRDSASGWVDFQSQRQGTSVEQGNHFRYRPASPTRMAVPGSLEFFLIERYVLFAESHRRQLYTGTVIHEPYQFCDVELTQWSDSLLPLNGFDRMNRPPDHALTCRGVDVDVYGLHLHEATRSHLPMLNGG